MTPRPAWSLVLLLAAVPALATDPAWETADSRWLEVPFTDSNGTAHSNWIFKPHLDEAADGDSVPLYTLGWISGSKYQARASAFSAKADKATKVGKLKISLPGTYFTTSWTGPAAPFIFEYNNDKAAVQCTTNCHKPNKPAAEYPSLFGNQKTQTWLGSSAIIVLRPKEGPEPAPVLLFPDNAKAFNEYHINANIAPLPEPANNEFLVARRFLPLEMAFYNPALVPSLSAVTTAEIHANTAVVKATNVDPEAVDAWAYGRRAEIMTKAKDLHAELKTASASRPDKFSQAEGELLWAMVSNANVRASFNKELQKSLLDSKTRAAFVSQYRKVMIAQLAQYLDQASGMMPKKDKTIPAGAKGTVEPAWNTAAAYVKKAMTDAINGTPAEPVVVSKTVKSPAAPSKPKAQKPKPESNDVSDMFGN